MNPARLGRDARSKQRTVNEFKTYTRKDFPMLSPAVLRLRHRLAQWIMPRESGLVSRATATLTPSRERQPSPGPVADGANRHLVGRFQLLDLQPIKDRYKGDWEQTSGRIDRLVRMRIERHLAPGDICHRIRPTEHVIVFAGLSAEAAQAKCDLISREIAKAILGESNADELPVAVKLLPLPADTNIADADALGRALSKAEQDEAQKRSGGGSPEDLVECAAPALPTFCYEPMWRPGRGVICSYRCQASFETECSTLQRDFAVLAAATKQARGLMLEGRTLALGVPVAFETLGRYNERREYMRLLAEVPQPARKLLVFELGALPEGVPQSRLQEIVGPLRQHCRAVIAELPSRVTTAKNLQEASISAVGIDLGADACAAEQSLFEQIKRFRDVAGRARIPAYARGVSTLSLAAAAAASGFDYIAGKAVMMPLTEPRRIVRFGLTELYQPRA
jgi:hypothetical protein